MDSSRPQKTAFPFGVSTLAEVTNIIRTQCTDEEAANLEALGDEWREAAKYFLEVLNKELGIADTIDVKEIDQSCGERLVSISSDILFKQSFSMIPIEFKLVEIGKVVAPQRLVNLEYVEELKTTLTSAPSVEELIEFCLQPKQVPPEPKRMQIAPNVFTYSSSSVDFRFLGGYPKQLTEEDVKASTGGGLPMAAIVLLVGYGSPTCNVFLVGKRMILNNGFHRMYCLADMGVKYAPLVVQKVANPDLELQPVIAGLPKDYLIGHPRPVLVKDFLDKNLIKIIHTKPRMTNVQIGWNFQQSAVPI